MVAALALALAREASAQQAPATTDPEVFHPGPRVLVFADLTFIRASDVASICPGEELFRLMVGGHTGVDSFEPNPRGVYAGRVRVVVSRAPGGFAGSYTWADAEGNAHSGRFVHPGSTQCHCMRVLDLVATALGVPFAVMGMHLGEKYARARPPATPRPAMPCPTATPCPESPYEVWPYEPPMRGPKPEPKPPERWPLAVRLGVGVWPELIAAGTGSFGISAEVGVRYRFISLGAEAHGDPPLGSVTSGNVGPVSFARVSGALLLCAHYGMFAGCGVGDAGRVFFPNHIHYLPASVLYGAAGVRASLEFPVAPPWLFLGAAVDVRAPIHPASYAARGNDIFRLAGPSVGLGLGLHLELPVKTR